MAVSVQFWMDGQLVDGVSQWWQRLDLFLASNGHELPLLNAVDPEGLLVVTGHEIQDLARECQRALTHAPEHVRPFFERLHHLTLQAENADRAEIRFLGD